MIHLDKEKRLPLYEQLYEQLQQAIIQGELKRGEALRPIRVLAEELQVGKNTVNRAYQQLLSEGYIHSVVGSGYYVEDISDLIYKKTDAYGPRIEEEQDNYSIRYNFNYENIDGTSFPWTKWRQYVQNALLEESYQTEITYEENKGNLELRKSLCAYLNSSRGIRCVPEQIVISPGTQYAVDMIAEILPPAHYRVGFEEPGYDDMRNIFLSKGHDIIPLPMNDSGVDLHIMEQTNCNLMYLLPSHQFPTGVTTSLTRRLQLLEWAKNRQIYIIENDYDNEFTYGKSRLPSLKYLDEGDNVIYLSTLSKVLSPSIRCAYFVLPEKLMERYDTRYQYYYSSLPTFSQRALASFIGDGHLEKHVRKMSLANKKKHQIFIATMYQLLREQIEIYDATAGSHVFMRIKGCCDQKLLLNQMQKRGIKIYGTKEFWYQKDKIKEDTFLVGYNSIPEQEVERACTAFAAALMDIRKDERIFPF
ncbi:MAG: PLP-dependent aminotransferase family protein [Lachnospiraceae bacterium]|jgi:GntR family transcriptional regulator/MocR family aminotransferase